MQVHAVPSCNEGQGKENAGHQCEDLHQAVLLDVNLCLIGLTHLYDILLEVQDLPKQALTAIIQDVKIVNVIRADHLVVVVTQLVENLFKLLIIFFQAQNLVTRVQNLFSNFLTAIMNHGIVQIGNAILQFLKVLGISLEQVLEKEVHGSLIGGSLREILGCRVVAHLIFADDK